MHTCEPQRERENRVRSAPVQSSHLAPLSTPSHSTLSPAGGFPTAKLTVKAGQRKGKERKGNPDFREQCRKWNPVSCTARHTSVPIYQLSFINSCKQMFSRQVAVSVEAITACRCLVQPSSQRLPLLQLRAKISWIISYHLDQLLEWCWLTLHWGKLGSAHMILSAGSNQGLDIFQVAQQGLEEGVLPCSDLHVCMERDVHVLHAQKEGCVIRS